MLRSALLGARKWVEKIAFSWYICTRIAPLFGLLFGGWRGEAIEGDWCCRKKAVVKKWLIS